MSTARVEPILMRRYLTKNVQYLTFNSSFGDWRGGVLRIMNLHILRSKHTCIVFSSCRYYPRTHPRITMAHTNCIPIYRREYKEREITCYCLTNLPIASWLNVAPAYTHTGVMDNGIRRHPWGPCRRVLLFYLLLYLTPRAQIIQPTSPLPGRATVLLEKSGKN